MKKSKEILRDPPPDFRLYLALTMVVVGMALIAMGSVACAQDVSLQIEVSDPDANGIMHLKGSVVCTGLHPEGQQIVTNDVWVHVEYMMDDGGKWPIFYESQHTSRYNRPATCLRIGGRCITDEEREGVHVQGGGVLLSKSLEDSDAGKSFSFERDLNPPTNATRARVVAHLEHTLTSGAAKWVAHQHLWDSASFDILLPNPDSDGDGVPDKIDKCPKTPPDTIVDDNGCPAKYDCDDNYVCDHDKGENCAICPKECPCNPGEKCDPSDSNADPWGCVAVAITDSDGDGVPDGVDQCLGTPAGVAVDDKGCPIGPDSDGDGVPDDVDACHGTPAGVAVDDKGCPIKMQLSVTTDKKAYSPGETVKTVIIRGSVWDAKGGLTGASIAVDVSGTKLSATTDSSGKYKCEFPLPPEVTQGTYTVTATASYSGYPSVSKSTSFTIGAFAITLKTDKDVYNPGDEIRISGTVISPDKDVANIPVAIGVFDSKGDLYGDLVYYSDTNGEYNYPVPIPDKDKYRWGIWTIKARALKKDYPEARAEETIKVTGCGDQECQEEQEDCFVCPQDCDKCGPNEICDPLSVYKNPETLCSPKMACIFISKDMSAYERSWLVHKRIHIRRYYQSLGYKISTVYVNDMSDVATYLSRPSTKAIAYFGHTAYPSIEEVSANSMPNVVAQAFKENYELFDVVKYIDYKEEIAEKAKEKSNHPNLDYAYIHACYSLADKSLANYLLCPGGTYWGHKGKLNSFQLLTEFEKP